MKYEMELIARQEKAAEMANNLKKYEIEEWNKAFEIGTDKAWKQYRTNVKKRANKIFKETGIEVNLDAIMA